MTLRVETPPSFRPEREWVLRVVLGQHLGLEYDHVVAERNDVRIADDAHELVLPDVLFACEEADWLTERALPALPLARWRVADELPEAVTCEPDLPILYGSSGRLDVFGGVFFLLSRYEELVSAERDRHERFPAGASLAVAEGFLERPLADEYVEVLWALLKRVWPGLERRPLEFRMVLTHDVDAPRSRRRPFARELLSASADVLRRRDPSLAVRRLRFARGAGADPLDTFDQLMASSESRGLRSAFYFMSGSDAEYSLYEPAIRELLRRVAERGHEIGFHAGYGSFRDLEVFQSELEELRRVCLEEGIEQEIRGGRQHFLRWENPATWRLWDEAGLEYDSTVGFADAPGFRCGTCRDYPVFDLQARRSLNVLERPLIAMETSAFVYLGRRPGAAVARFATLKERCRRVGGDFVALWHNTTVADRIGRRVYEQVLDA